jgi:carboxymethylenebutenolidase
MEDQKIIITTPDGAFSGYLAVPFDTPKGVVLVAQEIFGVNDVMKRTCEAYADKGFMAFCPDLFWRLGQDIELSDDNEAETQKAFDLYQKFDFEKGIHDLKATLDVLKERFPTLKTAGVGYCLGGSLAYRMAFELPVDAAVAYYGIGMENALTQRPHAPLLLHIAAEDIFVSQGAQTAIIAHFEGDPKTQWHVYDRACHAFARIGGKGYSPILAELANSRTYDFLSLHLS